MFRRKSRNVHNTAYTGVNHVAPQSSQPNMNALAAALTIGQSIKQKSSGKQAQGHTNSIHYITREQPQPPQQPTPRSSSGSLLKRNSIVGKQQQQQQQSPQPKSINHQHQFRDFSGGSITSTSSPSTLPTPVSSSHSKSPLYNNHQSIVYDIDDSFNDSYLDEITEETNQIYLNNQQNLKDLKLSHQPIKTNSRSNLNAQPTGPVKMVKKYVPTPNGIKIIEVPEANFKQEMARNNSIRSGTSISRSGSLRNIPPGSKRIPRSPSLSSVSQQHKNLSAPSKKPPSRLSSLIQHQPPSMTPMTENVDLEDQLGHSDEVHEQQLKMKQLQEKIDQEKNFARELELKRKEYESLKLKNDNALKSLENPQSSYVEVPTIKEPEPEPVSVPEPTPVVAAIPEAVNVPVQEEQYKSVAPEEIEEDEEEEQEEDDDDDEEDVPIINRGIIVDEVSKKHLVEDAEAHEVDEEDDEDQEEIDEVEKPALAPITSEFDKSQELIDEDEDGDVTEPQVKSAQESKEAGNTIYSNVGHSGSELGIINQYGNFASNELLNRDSIVENTITSEEDDEEDEGHGQESGFAKSLRPTFDSAPSHTDEVPISSNFESSKFVDESSDIEDEEHNVPDIKEEAPKVLSSDDTLQVPQTLGGNDGSSNSSLYSQSSKDSPKKLKSAMKNSSSFYNSNASKAKNNAAHEAYLSLTTAENTRLNSKLSSNQLNDGIGNITAYPGAASHNSVIPPPTKRLSQSTLRKSVPNPVPQGQPNLMAAPPNPSGMASRTLRPQSYQQPPGQSFQQTQDHPRSLDPNAGGMSGRSLRGSYIQPVAPHPALQPNYQSPSKLKAAELYAKANSRPQSVFRPLSKRSSFSRESGGNGPNNGNGNGNGNGNAEQNGKGTRTTLRDPIPRPGGFAGQPPQQHVQAQAPLPQQHQAQISHLQPPPQHPQQQNRQSRSNGRGFSSRFDDSDDEGPTSGGGVLSGLRNGSGSSNGKLFSSRFNDSDEEIHFPKPFVQSSPAVALPGTSIPPSLRASSGASEKQQALAHAIDEAKQQAEKPKKKFGKLRKLFGSSN
ncbi:serine-rich protein [Scheffersomyces coipomensis]|uniref:serine-rich protein n=1 Tax=Scheffersomyces coipomensis TaxID=1788519 RepID=UPI00315C4D4E